MMSQESLRKPTIKNKEFFSDLIEKQRAEIEDLNFQKQVLVLDLDDAYNLQSSVLEHNDNLDNENTELRKENQMLDHKLEQYKLQKQDYVRALEAFHEKQTELEGQIKGLKLENQIKERKTHLNSEINDLKEQNQILKEENQILKNKLYQNEFKKEKQFELENQIHDLKFQNQKHKEHVAKLEETIAQNTESMNHSLLRQQRQFEVLVSKDIAYKEKQVELENQIKELKLENQKQLKTQDDLEVENKTLKGSLHIVYDDNSTLKSEINDLKEKNQSLKNQNESQNERQFELSNQIKELKLESQEQLKTQNDLESKNKNLRESLHNFQKENFSLQSTLNYVEAKNEFWKQQNKSHYERNADLENQIQILKDQITAFKENVAKDSQQIQSISQIQGNPDKKEQIGNTDLHYIALNGPPQLTNEQKLILKYAKDINIKNITGTTPLHLAVQNEKIEMVQVLLEHGAKINAQDNCKMTPLHISAWKGNAGMTKLLLKYGARKDLVNEKGWTPLKMAKICHNENIMALLL